MVYQATYNPESVTQNREPGNQFLKFNYEICQGINLLKLGMVMEEMVKKGWLTDIQYRIFQDQAAGLLAIISGENGRSHDRILAEQGGVAIECEHDWEYLGYDRHGSHKGEDFYRCRKCGKSEYRP